MHSLLFKSLVLTQKQRKRKIFYLYFFIVSIKVELAETEAGLKRRSFYIISDPVPSGNETGGPHECGCCSAARTVPRTSNLGWKPADP